MSIHKFVQALSTASYGEKDKLGFRDCCAGMPRPWK